MKSIALKALVAAVGMAGLAGTILLPRDGLPQSALALALLLALAALAGSRSVRIPGLRIQITAADVFTFCALATLAPVATPIVALAGVLGAVVGPRRRPLSVRTLFNLGAVTLSAVAAARVFVIFGGTTDVASGHNAVILLASAAVFLAVNLILVAVGVRLETGREAVLTIATIAPCAAVACLTSSLLALGLALTLVSIGPLAAVLGLLCTGPLVTYFREHKKRVENLATTAELVADPKPVEA